MADTLFISDLHLHPARPAVIQCFLDFLENNRGRAQALYILGDLFESWVGDDHPEVAYEPVKQALNHCAEGGTPVYLLHGNRDFLLGEQFAQQTAVTLLDDPAEISLYGTAALLLHGDSLCIDDREYQQLRQRLRDPDWQRQALALPLQERLELADQARELSALSNRQKDEFIMDVNEQEVRRVFETFAVSLMIHGHTHRPGIHRFDLGGRECTRVVLGDWYRQGSVLRCNETQFELETLPV